MASRSGNSFAFADTAFIEASPDKEDLPLPRRTPQEFTIGRPIGQAVRYQIAGRAQIAESKSVACGMTSDGGGSAETVLRMCQRITSLSKQPGRRFSLAYRLELRSIGLALGILQEHHRR